MEKVSSSLSALICIAYSCLMVFCFALNKLLKLNIKPVLWRLIILNIFSVGSYYLLRHYNALNYIRFWNEPFISKIAILGTTVGYIGPFLQWMFEEYDYYIGKNSFSKYIKIACSRAFQPVNLLVWVLEPIGEEIVFRVFSCSLLESTNMTKIGIYLIMILFGNLQDTFDLIFSASHKFSTCMRLIKEKMFSMFVNSLFSTWITFVWLKTHCASVIFFIHCYLCFMDLPVFNRAFRTQSYTERVFIILGYVFGVFILVGSIMCIVTTKSQPLF